MTVTNISSEAQLNTASVLKPIISQGG